jgi:hypothetical protein
VNSLLVSTKIDSTLHVLSENELNSYCNCKDAIMAYLYMYA